MFWIEQHSVILGYWWTPPVRSIMLPMMLSLSSLPLGFSAPSVPVFVRSRNVLDAIFVRSVRNTRGKTEASRGPSCAGVETGISIGAGEIVLLPERQLSSNNTTAANFPSCACEPLLHGRTRTWSSP